MSKGSGVVFDDCGEQKMAVEEGGVYDDWWRRVVALDVWREDVERE